MAARRPDARRPANHRSRSAPIALGAVHGAAAGRGAPGADQPGPDRPRAASRSAFTALVLVDRRGANTARPTTRRLPRRSPGRGGYAPFLLMIAAFYGGELVWRERDRKLNELIDSTAGSKLGDDDPQDPRDLPRTADRQRRGGDAPALFYQLVEGARTSASAAISQLVHRSGCDRRPADRGPRRLRPGAKPQQICRLGNPARLVRRRHLPQQHGIFGPALHLWQRARACR